MATHRRACKAFSMSIQDSIIVGEFLIATWIDRELLIARMGCLPLNEPFKEGVERGDLRTARNLEQAILPGCNVGTCPRCRTACHDQYG